MNSRVTPFLRTFPGSSISLRRSTSVKTLGHGLGPEPSLYGVIGSGFKRSRLSTYHMRLNQFLINAVRGQSMKKFIYTFAFLLFSAAVSLHAQTTNGSIEGSVTDPSGGAVAGASVTARNMDTGLTQATTTTQAGIYSLPNLPPGRYSVTVEAPNLKKYAQEGVTVTTGTAIALNILMQLGAVSESVTVTADATQLQTTTSEIGATVSPTLVANLPLQVKGTVRNPVEFIRLVPGFVGNLDNNPGSNSSDDFKGNGGTNQDSFPNEDFRSGNFAALCTEGFTAGVCNNLSHQLYDPTTHAAIPGDNLTNDSNFTPSTVMTNIFKLLPPTNGNLNNNVIDRTVSTTTANLYDVKIDHSFSDKHRISGGFDYDNTKTGGISDLGPIFGSSTPQNTRYARISDNYVFSPTLVNQALFGFSRRFRGEGSNSIGLGYPDKIGLTGVNNTTFPCIKWGDTNYQVNNCGASQFADNVFQINDAVSWVKGKHSFKFGGEIRMLQFNVRRLTQSSGEFDFAAAQTSSTGDASGLGGNSVASGLFGLSDTTTLNYGNFSGVRYKDFALYAQDTYRFTSKLTLNYGLRYDIDLPASEAFDRFSMVDPTLPNPDAGNILGAYTYFGSGPGRNGRKRPQDIYHKAFGPRLGFAYSINSKTVVRGGYGIYYEARS